MRGAVGLSPIVGAFAVGMAVASTRVIRQMEDYVSKLEIIFAPLFFAIIGAQVDLRGININVLYLAGVIVAVAIITKLAGCGLPAMIFLKNKNKAMKVGIGMISRGEVGLIVAGVGVSSGVLNNDIYTTVIIMVASTTIITPIWLKIAYRKHSQEPDNAEMQLQILDREVHGYRVPCCYFALAFLNILRMRRRL